MVQSLLDAPYFVGGAAEYEIEVLIQIRVEIQG